MCVCLCSPLLWYNSHPFPTPIWKVMCREWSKDKYAPLLPFLARKLLLLMLWRCYCGLCSPPVVLQQPTPTPRPPMCTPFSDPAHVPYAHHGVIARRVMGTPMTMDIDEEVLPGASVTPTCSGIMSYIVVGSKQWPKGRLPGFFFWRYAALVSACHMCGGGRC